MYIVCTLYDVDMSEDGAKTPPRHTNQTQPPEYWPVAGEDSRCSHCCCYCRVSRATRRRRGGDFIGSCGGIIGIIVSLVYDFIGGPPIVTDTEGLCITIPARSCFSFYQILAEPPYGSQYRCLVQGLPWGTFYVHVQLSNSTTHQVVPTYTVYAVLLTLLSTGVLAPETYSTTSYPCPRHYEYVSHRCPIARRSDGPKMGRLSPTPLWMDE